MSRMDSMSVQTAGCRQANPSEDLEVACRVETVQFDSSETFDLDQSCSYSNAFAGEDRMDKIALSARVKSTTAFVLEIGGDIRGSSIVGKGRERAHFVISRACPCIDFDAIFFVYWASDKMSSSPSATTIER